NQIELSGILISFYDSIRQYFEKLYSTSTQIYFGDLAAPQKLCGKSVPNTDDRGHHDLLFPRSAGQATPDPACAGIGGHGYGDCEDYVLLKRRMLIQAGWPREALLITVVRDSKDEGHAVLTVKTDKGDYVLDNQAPDVLLWSDTGYRFVKRQSQADPNVWVALGDPRPA